METPRANAAIPVRQQSEQPAMKVIRGCARGPYPMDAVVVGPSRTRDLALQVLANLPFRLVAFSGVVEAECWLTTYHVDLLLIDEVALGDHPEERLVGLRDSSFQVAPVVCVVGESRLVREHRHLLESYAYAFSYAETSELRAFIKCKAAASTAAKSLFTLGGSLPAGGVRTVLSLLEAAQHSGRLVVQPRDATQDQTVLWVVKGEPQIAYSGGVRHDDPLEQITEVNEGWFTFIQAEIDRDTLRMVEAWSRGAQPDKAEPSAPGKALGLRDSLEAGIASARNIGEIRDAVQSVLDAGIDRAAEDDDTLLMDRLADVSILLQKNRIEEAAALLTTLLK